MQLEGTLGTYVGRAGGAGGHTGAVPEGVLSSQETLALVHDQGIPCAS
jgi:hypothetical protein